MGKLKISRKSDASIASVTSLPESPELERSRRMRQYAIAMSIRTVCVVLVVFLPSPWLWIAAIGAIFLPYFAVVIANQESHDSSVRTARNTLASIEE